MTTLGTRVTVPQGVMFRDLDGEAVLLELQTGRYYGLNETGTRMWLLLLEHGRVGSAFHALLEEYEVSVAQLKGELTAFVDSLSAQRLLCTHED